MRTWKACPVISRSSGEDHPMTKGVSAVEYLLSPQIVERKMYPLRDLTEGRRYETAQEIAQHNQKA